MKERVLQGRLPQGDALNLPGKGLYQGGHELVALSALHAKDAIDNGPPYPEAPTHPLGQRRRIGCGNGEHVPAHSRFQRDGLIERDKAQVALRSAVEKAASYKNLQSVTRLDALDAQIAEEAAKLALSTAQLNTVVYERSTALSRFQSQSGVLPSEQLKPSSPVPRS